jgi:hypothetical protein
MLTWILSRVQAKAHPIIIWAGRFPIVLKSSISLEKPMIKFLFRIKNVNFSTKFYKKRL